MVAVGEEKTVIVLVILLSQDAVTRLSKRETLLVGAIVGLYFAVGVRWPQRTGKQGITATVAATDLQKVATGQQEHVVELHPLLARFCP